LQRRIEAHITINFVAYKVYKELERILKIKNATISPKKAIEIAKNLLDVLDDETISLKTALSVKEIKKLRDTN
jgi:hypothetical protein